MLLDESNPRIQPTTARKDGDLLTVTHVASLHLLRRPHLHPAHVLPAFTSTFSGRVKLADVAAIAAAMICRISSTIVFGTSRSTRSLVAACAAPLAAKLIKKMIESSIGCTFTRCLLSR